MAYVSRPRVIFEGKILIQIRKNCENFSPRKFLAIRYTIMNILQAIHFDSKTILVSYPDLPMRSGYETSATPQACTHDYSVHGTVMEELLQLNEGQ